MTRPFRVGTTSFIYRDHMLPNVRRLAPHVDDVELLVFDVDADLPSDDEVAELVELKARHGLSYTVHTPLGASLASDDERRRVAGVDQVRRALAWARPLAPHGAPVHVYLGEREHDPAPPRDLDAWRARAERSLRTLISDGTAAPTMCIECIDYDFALIDPVVRALGLSIALDVGHLHRDGRALGGALDAYLGRARIIQWHGTEPGGRDHRSLAHVAEEERRWLVGELVARRFAGVVTLEVFREDDFWESLGIVEALAPR
jgi:sugar phosphate isomerase/epimerase